MLCFFNLFIISLDDSDPDPYQTDEASDYQPSTSDSEHEDEREEEHKKRTRKRTRQEENWCSNKRKLRRASGLAYNNVKGQEVPAKVFQNPVCKCNRKCCDKIKVDQCKTLFDNFYKLANFDLQSAYIFGQVHVIKKNRVYTENEQSRRNMTRIYNIPNEEGGNVKVCKEFFKSVLQISGGRLSRVLEKNQSGFPL